MCYIMCGTIGGPAHHRRHGAAHHLQRVPASHPRQDWHTRARPHTLHQGTEVGG